MRRIRWNHVGEREYIIGTLSFITWPWCVGFDLKSVDAARAFPGCGGRCDTRVAELEVEFIVVR